MRQRCDQGLNNGGYSMEGTGDFFARGKKPEGEPEFTFRSQEYIT
jgi:hypothetical protein